MDDVFFEIVDDVAHPDAVCWKGGVPSSASALFFSSSLLLLAALFSLALSF